MAFSWLRKIWPGTTQPAPAPPPPLPPDDDDTESFGNQLKGLAQCLITLEINTIIKENMIAGPMPTVANALVEIASSYIRAFEVLGINMSALYPPVREDDPLVWQTVALPLFRAGEARPEGVPGPTYFSLPSENIRFHDLFLSLRQAARLSFQRYGADLNPEQRVQLRRMEDNSDKLRVILEENKLGTQVVNRKDLSSRRDIIRPEPELTVRDRLTIKKIWEVGSERIIAQTVIQLDGDVVTRLPSDFGKVADVQLLLDLHQKGLSTAISRWDSLMRAALAVIEGLLGIKPSAPRP